MDIIIVFKVALSRGEKVENTREKENFEDCRGDGVGICLEQMI